MTTTLRSWRMWVGSIPDAALRGNSKVHPRYRGKAKNKWRTSGFEHVIADMPDRTGIERLRLTFTFHHWMPTDLDNLAIGMKPFVDGMVYGIGTALFDDDPAHVIYGEHQFVKCKKGNSKTEVLVEEIG